MSSTLVSEFRKRFEAASATISLQERPKVQYKRQPLLINVTCQTDLPISPAPLGIRTSLEATNQQPLSPRSAIIYTEAKGEPYQPRTQIKCFEDEYYSKADVSDYARVIRFGLVEEQADLVDNGESRQAPKVEVRMEPSDPRTSEKILLFSESLNPFQIKDNLRCSIHRPPTANSEHAASTRSTEN